MTVKVPAGGRVTMAAGGKEIVIRDATGKTTRRPVGGRPPAKVGVGAVKLTYTKGRLVVSGRVTIPLAFVGRDATVGATATRGRRVIATETVTISGARRSEPVRVAIRVKRRAGLNVTLGVGLVKTNGAIALGSVRKVVPVR